MRVLIWSANTLDLCKDKCVLRNSDQYLSVRYCKTKKAFELTSPQMWSCVLAHVFVFKKTSNSICFTMLQNKDFDLSLLPNVIMCLDQCIWIWIIFLLKISGHYFCKIIQHRTDFSSSQMLWVSDDVFAHVKIWFWKTFTVFFCKMLEIKTLTFHPPRCYHVSWPM